MKAIAKLRTVRHSDRKLRRVADMIRGQSVDKSFAILNILRNTSKGAVIIEGVLKSAVANLQQSEAGSAVGTDALKVSMVMIDRGPIIKRIRPRAQGRAYRIQKNLSHVTVEVRTEV
jgi:large subunit ribosomal protein L22